jgi:tetratricopeptide (TPR) repeat protein
MFNFLIPFLATFLINSEDYDNALNLLNSIKITPSNQYFIYYHKGYCYFQLNHKKEAQDNFERVVEWFGEAPPLRWQHVSYVCLRDLELWSDQLDDIARKMSRVKSNIVNGRTGDKTQAEQKEIVDWLDKKIAQLEQEKENKGQNGKNDKNEQRNAQNPLEESQIGGETGPGQISPKKLQQIAESWGKLPEKERQRFLIDLRKSLPYAYQEAVESYFKKLEQGNRGSPYDPIKQKDNNGRN